MVETPYEILGISKHATPDEIKCAYRKLAMKYHPDRNGNKTLEEQKDCEEKFKKINNAYTELTSNNTYSSEEQTSFSSFKDTISSFFESFKDNQDGLFSNVMYDIKNFTEYYKRNSEKKEISQTMYYNINCNLHDVYNGVVKTLDIVVERKCTKCLGLGKNLINQTGNCCINCNGRGLVEKNESLILYLDRKQQTFEKRGNETLHKTRGTIQVNLLLKEHEQFHAYHNYDLMMESSFEDLEINHFTIQHVNNESIKLIPFSKESITNIPHKIKIENKGLLYPVGYEKERGDLWIFIYS